MTNPQQKLLDATNRLSKYYKLPVFEDLLKVETLNSVTGNQQNPANIKKSDKILDTLLANFINASSGTLTVNKLIRKINQWLTEVGTEETNVKDRLNEIFQIYFSSTNLINGTTTDKSEFENKTIYRPTINEILEYSSGQGETINSSTDAPTKDKPNLSIVLSNSSRVGLAHRDVNSIVIFLNGIPNVEISKAVPFIDIQFFFPKSPINPNTKKLQSLSLPRFLVGAKEITNENSSLSIMANAGQVAGVNIAAGEPQSDNYATAGMELFTSPQTLTNANDADNTQELRYSRVLDKFRPFMTLKSFEVTIAPTKGLMSYKTANLSFVLHDRSRLAEIAEFIRADLYGKTEILIEYGWSHPDSESLKGSNNPYADLINGMRVKEKYGVINSSFTFDEVGQAIITLKLAMRGGSDFDTELCASDSDSVGNIITEIEHLQKVVGDYREKVFKRSNVGRAKEIRGVQILDAAQDAINQVNAGKDLKKALSDFERGLRENTHDAKVLIDALNKLFSEESNKRKGKTITTASAVSRLRKTILKSIDNKVKKLDSGPETDPWLIDKPVKGKGGRQPRQAKLSGLTKEQRQNIRQNFGNIQNISSAAEVSLAKLILNFIAEPLANTKKFDDIQFVFYPFNEYAGFARNKNIANFAVNLVFFVQEFRRYRLEHIGKSGNLNLRQFLDFIADTIVDDPAARSYGLTEFFREVFNEDGTQRSVEIADSVTDYQANVEKKLKEITPDGSFKVPQIEFYIEALPEVIGQEENEDSSQENGKTILRIHVFDKLNTSYNTLGALLASTRDAEIESLNNNLNKLESAGGGGNKGVVDEQKLAANAILAAAHNKDLIQIVPGTDGDSPVYRISGDINALKEFMKETMPYIIYGTAGTTIKAANLSSVQDPGLSTVNILRSFEKNDNRPEGEHPGGLPMRIIPTELSMNTLGCPLLNFAQQFFVDFQTGTTADAIYYVVGVTHKFQPGEFSTDIKFTPGDGWGRYISLIDRVNQASKILQDIVDRDQTTDQKPS